MEREGLNTEPVYISEFPAAVLNQETPVQVKKPKVKRKK